MKPIRLLLSLLCVVVTLSAISAVAQTSHPVPRRANIILIIANGLGTGDLSCYGQTQFGTPNLDKLASEGIRFTRYSAASTNRSDARATLMIGKTPADAILQPHDITVAQLLGGSGYHNGYLGEWDLGDQDSASPPWRKGFDEFMGSFDSVDAENPYAEFMWCYEPNPNDPVKPYFNGRQAVFANGDGKKVQFIPDWYSTLAVNFMRENLPTPWNHHQPFFLVINWPGPGNGNRVVPTDAPFSEESWPQPEKNRAALISRLDDSVGKLMENLDQIGMATNTVIIFTSDTVPQKIGGTDPKFFRENASPDSLLVPLIVRWPGKIPAGKVADVKCSANDFFRTVANIGLVEPPATVGGVSLLPALLGQKQPPRPPAANP